MKITINLLSVQSLLIRTRFNGQALSTGTAFVANTAAGPVLLTNRHNVTGRDQNTNEPLSKSTGAIPNEIAILHNQKGLLGDWVERVEPLYSGENALWREHPALGAQADFVALPLTQLHDVDLHPYTVYIAPEHRMILGPADSVSVIGFPFGTSADGSAIWSTGFIASEPALDFDKLPVFLIDSRTREGQSGSPVIAYRNGGVIITASQTKMTTGKEHQFLGIYSGRINKDSDLGMVWKASAIQELLASFAPPRPHYGPSYVSRPPARA